MSRNRVLGGSLSQRTITANELVNHGVDVYNVNAPNGTPVTVTLDPTPADGDQVTIVDVGLNASTQPITIMASEDVPFSGGATTVSITVSGSGLQFTYSVQSGAWAVGGVQPPLNVFNTIAFGSVRYTGKAITTPVLVKYSSPDTVTPAQADSLADAAIAIVPLAEQAIGASEYGSFVSAWPSAPPIVYSFTSPGPLTPGATYYLSPTSAGDITSTRPTTSGQIVQVVGVAMDTQTLLFNLGAPIQL